MTLTIQLPDNLEAALRAHANANGISEEGYVRTLVERDLATATSAPVTRSQLAGQRIRELRKGNFLHGVSIKELIEEGRE
jgi:plasmid stability protein